MQGECEQCLELMREFTSYRDHVIVEKDTMRKEIQKCKQQLDKFMGKIDKRVDSRINEERLVNNHNLEKLQQFHQQELSKMQALMEQKDRLIEDMRTVLRQSEKEKKELIQTNTKILVEMSGQLGGGQKQEKDKSYWQLMKMYQFLMEENNELKKQMYQIRKNNIKQENKSILDSSQKPKSPTVYSSKQANKDTFNASRSFTKEAEPKEKKKVPKAKQHK